MAAKKRVKKRGKRRAGLGYAPDAHRKRAEGAVTSALQTIVQARRTARNPAACKLAMGVLVAGARRLGEAEAELDGARLDDRPATHAKARFARATTALARAHHAVEVCFDRRSRR